ncbi:hypothetical protein BX616_002130 [Lobosporangium transversale]|uniref:Uncharacterized protein n=1 Tax=Lobosporangium transversale TaxID=64571 RepID=A0A1Y2G8Y9_9FUNG|nr:hypothetical protein BCR41DRAFT_414256 [Lobosporangium transversale]KAF9919077.1 hypothetical protein BX616_002130 [Lobosporangium transversale]ORZ04463.1 hypothetical protein BCR41DRAFT_414256 [Lobosporangium transversale]|eukprot:XP_021876571.1 hypothetical protein BCR41DRAFT_414256 [Lobosporangium transversale]
MTKKASKLKQSRSPSFPENSVEDLNPISEPRSDQQQFGDNRGAYADLFSDINTQNLNPYETTVYKRLRNHKKRLTRIEANMERMSSDPSKKDTMQMEQLVAIERKQEHIAVMMELRNLLKSMKEQRVKSTAACPIQGHIPEELKKDTAVKLMDNPTLNQCILLIRIFSASSRLKKVDAKTSLVLDNLCIHLAIIAKEASQSDSQGAQRMLQDIIYKLGNGSEDPVDWDNSITYLDVIKEVDRMSVEKDERLSSETKVQLPTKGLSPDIESAGQGLSSAQVFDWSPDNDVAAISLVKGDEVPYTSLQSSIQETHSITMSPLAYDTVGLIPDMGIRVSIQAEPAVTVQHLAYSLYNMSDTQHLEPVSQLDSYQQEIILKVQTPQPFSIVPDTRICNSPLMTEQVDLHTANRNGNNNSVFVQHKLSARELADEDFQSKKRIDYPILGFRPEDQRITPALHSLKGQSPNQYISQVDNHQEKALYEDRCSNSSAIPSSGQSSQSSAQATQQYQLYQIQGHSQHGRNRGAEVVSEHIELSHEHILLSNPQQPSFPMIVNASPMLHSGQYQHGHLSPTATHIHAQIRTSPQALPSQSQSLSRVHVQPYLHQQYYQYAHYYHPGYSMG